MHEGFAVLAPDQIRRCAPTVQACADEPPPRVPAGGSRDAAIFLDRDGTLIVDKPYQTNPAGIELLPGAVEGLSALRDAGYRLIVVTNQSGIARGYFDVRALVLMHQRLNALLAANDLYLTAYYFCPHHVAGRVPGLAHPCACRKPAPGMILRAAADWSIDLRRSWMIGDLPTDIAAATAAGCRALQVGICENGASERPGDLREAAKWIIASGGRGSTPAVEAHRSARRR